MLPARIHNVVEPDLEASTSSESREPETGTQTFYIQQSAVIPLFSKSLRLPSHSKSSSTSLPQYQKTPYHHRQTDHSRNQSTSSTTVMLYSTSSTSRSTISSSPPQAPSQPASHTFTPPHAVFKATNQPPEPKLDVPTAILPSRPKPIKQPIHELQRRSGSVSEHE